MKHSKLTTLKVKTFLTDLTINKSKQTLALKGGYHDEHTACICTAGASCDPFQQS